MTGQIGRRLSESRIVILLKNKLFQIPHVVYMHLDSLDNLQKLQVHPDYSITTYRRGVEGDWKNLIKRSFTRLLPPDIDQLTAAAGFDPDGFFFLTYQNQTVGSVYARQAEDAGLKFGDVVALCVVPEQRGRKLGSLLLSQALNYFKSKGLKSVYLDVDEFNTIAVKTYLAMGFQFAKQHPRINLTN